MHVDIPAGKYVVAVSGGVDSVVLLDIMRLRPGLTLTVAHLDHGIRDESDDDRRFVQQLAAGYGLPFVYDQAELGPGASEAAAREARYAFLERVRQVSGASAVATAHHRDDVLETVLINLLRGTGRRGLSSVGDGEQLIRPLRTIPKDEIIAYARRHGLAWQEDKTNESDDYLRNRIRHRILPNWSTADKDKLFAISQHMRDVNQRFDAELRPLVEGDLDRAWFVTLPHAIATEVIAAWLRLHAIGEFDSKLLERLTIAAKTAVAGKRIDVANGYSMSVADETLALARFER